MMQLYKDAICKALNIKQEQIKEYPDSYQYIQGNQLLLCKIEDTKKILISGKGDIFSEFQGELIADSLKICPLSHENRLILNQYLPFTVPSAFGRHNTTFGVGDRLGLATPGHIRSMKNTSVKPILAQQSKRELNLTGRTYKQVLDDACFAVFQEGYKDGFGADGDHLKQPEEIQDALECGYTMITLDCSEKIGRGIEKLPDYDALQKYSDLPANYRKRIESTYLDKQFLIGSQIYSFSKEDLIECVLIYKDVIDFAELIYFNYLTKAQQKVDFELSIDETESVTSPLGHLFVAMELINLKVEIDSLAPKFTGEFQKGIDYIGDIRKLKVQLRQHADIADHFGYKLSIHSGSDKFSVFPMIGDFTNGRLHIKTSGTNWLEAVGTIAECNPALYRSIHKKALEHFDEARNFYHVSADLSKIADIDKTDDRDLLNYLADDNSRQLIHITYGYILQDKSLKEEINNTLGKYEDHYYQRLESHIGRHLKEIGLI